MASTPRGSKQIPRYIPSSTLPLGSVVLHGTSTDNHFTGLIGPSWVTDNEGAARWFSDWHGAEGPRRVLSFRVVREPHLLEFDTEWMTEQDAYAAMPQRLADLLGMPAEDLDQTDIREMSSLLCDAGYDGWIAQDFLQGEGGGSDIMLCEPMRWLKYKGVEWIDRPPKGFTHRTRNNPSPTRRKRPGSSAKGDCYEAAGRYMMDACLAGSEGLVLVHGEVAGQGPMGGVTFGHAWVLDGDMVIDRSNGRDVRLPRAVYYALGQIDRLGNLHEYTWPEMRANILKYKTWGPWDLKTKL